MKIKWYGTASISIESNGQKILFDPFVPLFGSKVKTKLSDFIGYDNILITHGHFDHCSNIPKLAENSKFNVFCTNTPYNTLVKKGVSKEYFNKIKPGQVIKLDNFEIEVFQGKHIEYDKDNWKYYALYYKCFTHFFNIPYIIKTNNQYKENGETLIYRIKVENKIIYLLGSIGIDELTRYPKGCDLLILPYQGKRNLVTPALEVINELMPKAILFDHYDDTFPPITKQVSTKSLEAVLDNKIKIIKDIYNTDIEI